MPSTKLSPQPSSLAASHILTQEKTTAIILLGLSVSTGLNNAHFVQDIGAAYLAFATNIGLALIYRTARFPLVLAGAVFIVAHALFHVLDRIAANSPQTHSHADYFWPEFFSVMVPGIL